MQETSQAEFPAVHSRLRRESGCCGLLNWRLDLDPGIHWGELATALERDNWRWVCRQATLLVARRSDGHEIAMVPASGRVQIRVYRLVEHDRRASVAAQLADQLLDQIARLG